MRTFIKEIHERAMTGVKSYKFGRIELLESIELMERYEGFRDFNRGTLWEYCKKDLKLDDSECSAFIGIARKSIEMPSFKQAIKNDQIHISNARQLVPILTKENQDQWIEKATTLSKRDLQKQIASHFPKHSTKEGAKFVGPGRMQFECGLKEEIYDEFLNIQNLVSQAKQRHCDFEATQEELILFYKNAKDPLVKAQRANARKLRKQKKQNLEGEKLSAHNISPQAPAHVKTRMRQYKALLKHEINLRDKNQCVHVDEDGNRCEQKRWLEFHHVIEVAKGGENTLRNMKTLCWAHHKLTHSNRLSDQILSYQTGGSTREISKNRLQTHSF